MIKNGDLVGKSGLQIRTFWRSLQTGKMSSLSRNGGRQTTNAGNVRSRDPLPFAGKNYSVLNLSIYAPNDVNQQVSFFKDLQNQLQEYSEETIIIGGDFKCTLSEIDKKGGNLTSR